MLCYPVVLLGPSPEWYKSKAYRGRGAGSALGARRVRHVDRRDEVRVHDPFADMRYMILPAALGTDGLSEAALADLVTRNGLIGVAEV